MLRTLSMGSCPRSPSSRRRLRRRAAEWFTDSDSSPNRAWSNTLLRALPLESVKRKNEISTMLKRYCPTSVLIRVLICTLALLTAHADVYAQEPTTMLVRISEIEVFSQRLDEYQRILAEEAEASVRLEPGVLCIFPSAQRENPTQIRILEIYANRDAYNAHIRSPHFQKYKTSTLEMVKSLRLVDMHAMDTNAMPLIFKKMGDQP
ncbi:putative quinol monooxygenase [Caballeronia catudaia]|nr:antibiotic biosynthesis monooxygenase [Caballeronia catudaia]